MRRCPHPAFLIIGSLLILLASRVLPIEAQEPAVRAVLFYSPACPHCHKVISEDLPPLLEKYGERLQIIGVDTTQPRGQALYQAAIQRYGIPEERRGVPTLIIGDVVLVGSLEIPQQLPDLVEKYLAQGGLGWPDIPSLAEALATAQPAPTAAVAQPTTTVTSAQTLLPTPPTTTSPTSPPSSTPALTPTPTRTVLMVTDGDPPGWWARLARDPVGNALAIVALAGMVLVVGYVPVTWRGERASGVAVVGNFATGLGRPVRGRLPGLRGDATGGSRMRAGGRLQHGAAERIRLAVRAHPDRSAGARRLYGDFDCLGCATLRV